MAVFACGGRHFDDVTDWIASTSVSSTPGENRLTQEILRELFSQNHHDNMQTPSATKNLKKNESKSSCLDFYKSSPVSGAVSNDSGENKRDGATDAPAKPEADPLIVRKINGSYSFDNFDESQHVYGCPLKWLYNKKLSEKNRMYRIERRCETKSARPEVARKEPNRKVRDRTPADVKIHKMNLLEKRVSSGVNCLTSKKNSVSDEIRRRNLAAKLNWRPHGGDGYHDDGDDSLSETFSELSCRQNYLPPRPLVGMKPLLTILLFPKRDANCCGSRIQVQSESPLRGEDAPSPTLSIKSLNLPVLTSIDQNPNLKNLTQTPRTPCKTMTRRSKTANKKHQIPNQVTINLREIKPDVNLKFCHPHSAKRSNPDKTKDKNNLTTLVYQLSDKSNSRRGEGFEDLIRDIAVEDDDFKFRRFFRMEMNSDRSQAATSSGEQLRATTAGESLNVKLLKRDANHSEMNLTCEKVRIFEKIPKKRK